jgi:cell division protease FtsH
MINKDERLKILKNTGQILKTEFVGLDDIIDQIINSVSPWYITPELITRPTVISIWGMTGTGKTSVVRRLTELLGIKQDSIFFDCGRCTADRVDIIGDIEDTFGNSPEDLEGMPGNVTIKGGNPVLIFDEFQYAKTIDEEGKETINSNIRPIWELLDSGIINVTDRYDWSFNKLCEFVEDLEELSKSYPDMKLKNGSVIEKEDVRQVLRDIGFIWYENRKIDDMELQPEETPSIEEEDSEAQNADPLRPLPLLKPDTLRCIVRRASKRSPGKGKELLDQIKSTKTLGDFYRILFKEVVTDRGGKTIDCTKALIFVIGNLDEAFEVSDDLNPDMDPDIFYDITKNVNIHDIKAALLKRYRPEQVARLGNNLIKYPTLQKKDFIKIIKQELERISKEFNTIVPEITVTYTENVEDLIYYEGVYPTQGVRPIFSSINMLLTPYLSEILLKKEEHDVEVNIDVEDFVTGFRCSTATLVLLFKTDSKKISNRRLRYPISLLLGENRDVLKRKKRFITSVHEAGHAVMFAWRTGHAPMNLVGVSIDRGGFCSTYIKDLQGEIQCRHDVDTEVMVSMAGYLAEEIVYGDRPDMTLMGSSSDIAEAWDTLARASYEVGYFEPVSFANRSTESNVSVPNGFDSENTRNRVRYFNGVEFENNELLPASLEEVITRRMCDLKEETVNILKTEKHLIKKIALYLGENGSMDSETFLDYVEKYGTIIHKDMMETIKSENGMEFYKKVLEED